MGPTTSTPATPTHQPHQHPNPRHSLPRPLPTGRYACPGGCLPRCTVLAGGWWLPVAGGPLLVPWWLPGGCLVHGRPLHSLPWCSPCPAWCRSVPPGGQCRSVPMVAPLLVITPVMGRAQCRSLPRSRHPVGPALAALVPTGPHARPVRKRARHPWHVRGACCSGCVEKSGGNRVWGGVCAWAGKNRVSSVCAGHSVLGGCTWWWGGFLGALRGASLGGFWVYLGC